MAQPRGRRARKASTVSCRRRWFMVFAALASLGVMLAGGACRGDDAETIVEQAEERNRPKMVLGEHFEGTAPVGAVLSRHAFRLLDTLVVTKEPEELAEGVRVVVRGTVRRWDPQVIENQLGVDFGDSVDDLDDDLVVVADHVEDAPENDRPRQR